MFTEKRNHFYWFSIGFQRHIHSVSQDKPAILIKSRGNVMKSCNCSALVSCGNDRTFGQSHPFSGLDFQCWLSPRTCLWCAKCFQMLNTTNSWRLRGSYSDTLCYCSHNGRLKDEMTRKMKWPKTLLFNENMFFQHLEFMLFHVVISEHFSVHHSSSNHSVTVIRVYYKVSCLNDTNYV